MKVDQMSWWEYDEQEIAGHERAVQLLGALAQSFDVKVTHKDELRWRTMLGVFRCLDDAIDSADDPGAFDIYTFEHHLKTGRGITGKLSTPVAEGFRVLYNETSPIVLSSDMSCQADADADSGRERREMRSIVIRLQSFARDAIKARKVRGYSDVIEQEARYKGAWLQIRRPTEQRLTEAEDVFNTWLVNFYTAYSSIDTFLDLHRDHKNGETKVEPTPWSYAFLAVHSLKATHRVFRAAPPEARKILMRASVSRGVEKLRRP